jgi:3-oxoadipate enol-lactonase
MSKKGAKIESGYAHINGAEIYYEILGKGKTLVFVHGLGLDCRMWDDQFFKLSDHYRMLRLDLRGFGKSSLPSAEMYAHHTDLKSLLEYLEIPDAYFCGLSMGGRVVIDFALTYPQMVSSLVLVDSALNGYSFKSFSLANIGTIAKASGIAEANQAWLHHELFSPARRQHAVADRLNQIVSSYSGWHWVNQNPWRPIDPPAIHQLEKISCPVLIIVGEEDLPDFHSIADILHSKIPDSRKAILHQAGHMSNMENSEAFNQLIFDFLPQ